MSELSTIMDLNRSSLHYVLVKEIIRLGYAPSVETLSTIFQRSKDEIVQHLKDLEEYHGVVLHPTTSEVWVIHPFSLAPTNFWVESKQGQWWGNCAWCSLGIAAILKEDVTITTTLGGESSQIKFYIKEQKLVTDQSLFVHFPIQMAKAWDNVIFTCSVMQIFASEANVNDWCQRHHFSQGDIQPLDKIWRFAQIWYGNHLREDWTKWTTHEARQIFEQFDLTNSIWNIPGATSRF